MVQLEIQYFIECQHAEEALMLVRRYNERHPNTKVTIVKIEDDAQARQVGFRGSPTILINDMDMVGAPVPDDPRMACRFYPDGLPTLDEFEAIVEKMLTDWHKESK
jgi:hypothetical protein